LSSSLQAVISSANVATESTRIFAIHLEDVETANEPMANLSYQVSINMVVNDVDTNTAH